MMKSAQSFCIYSTAELHSIFTLNLQEGGRGAGGVGGDWEADIRIIENLRWLLILPKNVIDKIQYNSKFLRFNPEVRLLCKKVKYSAVEYLCCSNQLCEVNFGFCPTDQCLDSRHPICDKT